MFPPDVVSSLESGLSAGCLHTRYQEQGVPSARSALWPGTDQLSGSPRKGHALQLLLLIKSFLCTWIPALVTAWTWACETDWSSQALDELLRVPRQHQPFLNHTSVVFEQVFVYVANGHDAVISFLGPGSYCCACPVFHNYVIAGSLGTPVIDSRAEYSRLDTKGIQ